MRYEVRFTNQFKKDLKLAQKQGKDTDKLFEVIEKLANGEKLDAKYRDHDLTGNYKGCRECHVEPDWLLIYEVMGDVLVLALCIRVGIRRHTAVLRKVLRDDPAPIEVGEVRVEIVVDLKFAGQLVKQHPCTAAEHFDIPVARAAESCNNGFTQGFFTAYP